MKIIPLTKGFSSVVDDEDFDDLAGHRWCVMPSANGRNYAGGKRGKKTIYMHRQIMESVLGEPLGTRVVDHMDGDTLNNQRANLRAVTQVENMRNAIKRATNTSGYTGVVWHAQTGKWNARIKVNYKAISLGLYDCKEEANAARLKAEKELWGIHPRRALEHGQ